MSLSDIDTIIEEQLNNAVYTAKILGLDVIQKQKILELGCGIGFLGKVLQSYGHQVICCDDIDYNGSAINSIPYQKLLHYFNFHRYHFRFEIPDNLFPQKNLKMFQQLKTYNNNQRYDLILFRASDMWQLPEITCKDTELFITSLIKFLEQNGKIIIGYTPFQPDTQDTNFEKTKSFFWLEKWRTHKYSQAMGYYTWEILKTKIHTNTRNT